MSQAKILMTYSVSITIYAFEFWLIFKNFFNKQFLDLSLDLEYPFNSAGHSENINFFRSLSSKYTSIAQIHPSQSLEIRDKCR